MDILQFVIHSSISGQLGRFHFFSIGNNVAVNTGIQLPQVPALNSFGYTPRSGIAEPDGNFMFNFLRNHHPKYLIK